jgi:hypothetical protein
MLIGRNSLGGEVRRRWGIDAVKVDTASSFNYDPIGAITVRFFLWAKIDRLEGMEMP